MAELAPLSLSDRADIARQIGAMLPAASLSGPPGSGRVPQLGASYPVELLPLDALEAGQSLRAALRDTGRWHHQLETRRPAFARSEVEPGAAHTVSALVEADLAAAIERAEAWIDAADDSSSDEAHLLMVPAYHLTCIRLVGAEDDRIVVVERPQRLAQLALEHFYSAQEFLDILRGAAPIGGLPLAIG